MQYITVLSLGLAASASARASSSLLKRAGFSLNCDPNNFECQRREMIYFTEICMPTNETGFPDFNAPCNAVSAIELECIYGASGLATWLAELQGSTDSSYGIDDSTPMLSNTTQRDCICQSQIFNGMTGCTDCYLKHGMSQADYANEGPAFEPSLISSFSSSYCAATNTPTLGFQDVAYNIASTFLTATATDVSSSALTSTFTDPLGNNTAVSLYFTPSVTGTAAYVVAEATVTPSNGTVTSGSSTSESVATNSAGQIVATAAASNAGTSGSGNGTSGSGSASASGTSSGAGVRETAAVAGVLALAGFVALL
jgi:hypothetical protein